MNIPLAKPYIGEQEMKEVERVIRSKWLATGDTVRELERALAIKFRRRYCAAVSSGTVALYLALKVLKIKSVIIPALICDAVLYAALNAGASVIFADIVPETHNLDLSNLSENQLSNAGAVIVTHTYGHAADMDELDYYLKKYDLILVEDFAQATGGYFKDKILGSFGKIAITSFYASKSMATGHGGALLMDDEELYLKCKYCSGSRTNDYYENLIPMNLQMTDMQAAIGLVQLSKLDIMIEMRRNVASRYIQELLSSPIELIHEKSWAKHTYYKYAVMLPESVYKEEFVKKMRGFGIEIGKLYDPPLHRTKTAMNIIEEKRKLPIAEYLAHRTVSLPMFPELSGEDVEKVCIAISSVINDLRGRS